jgi:hypothetical protein
MRKTMNQATTRCHTYVSKTRAPWTVALHRKAAAAASIAACVFSLQMRSQPRLDDGSGDEAISLDALRDARRREGSP